MRNGKTLGFESGYNFVNKESRTVEILIPYAQNDYERSTNTIIYPFCLEPTTSNRNTTGMYNSLGWTIEKTWRVHKHWDKIQSSLRFRVSILQTHTTTTMMLYHTKSLNEYQLAKNITLWVLVYIVH